ncbi:MULTISPECIES: beta-phosphoglucomutase [Lacticaseibacillus]|uniref:Beta-phosphoglucomutase n=2 Tax=Lacticaseibacillus TaxID=2759736 RepID=A0AAN1C8A3_LACCA|nr:MULTISPECIES: beta-phosphoglucomutase [Lacticaseibacillus]ARY91068.1 beta-phosphoglucomutase [Lacticaseibacillus casei]KAB1969186.1 beta-phosphoglucomutase [Lacticaseibacillus casei]WLV81680.1 beta-phosphoglucomutase [Lacticaseibacillus sp. NCIMB 15473]WNX25629.1 beta-phosphoglucomutase [Lacticaseibacillus casei]WNX28400.1 beta-phosphoglucomutase [Lacticaseibacillus casei]
MLKGFIFDLDGVLTDTEKYHLAAWHELAEQLGIHLPSEADAALRGRARMDSLELILRYGHQEQNYDEAQKVALTEEKNRRYRALVASITSADILPGIPLLLEKAKQHRLKMAIASASKNAPMILQRLGLASQFDAIVDPSSLHHGKPDPEIYIKAQQLLQLQADEVISFEDAPIGIAAIKAAGQFAVGIGDADKLAAADYRVSTTDQLDYDRIVAAFEGR